MITGLTLKLQMQSTDVIYVYRQVKSVVSILRRMGEESEEEFERIFTQTSKLAKDLYGEELVLSQLRVNRHQMHRANIQATIAEECFRITLYNEFIWQERLLSITLMVMTSCTSCQASAAAVMLRMRPDALSRAVDFYQSNLLHALMFPVEY